MHQLSGSRNYLISGVRFSWKKKKKHFHVAIHFGLVNGNFYNGAAQQLEKLGTFISSYSTSYVTDL